MHIFPPDEQHNARLARVEAAGHDGFTQRGSWLVVWRTIACRRDEAVRADAAQDEDNVLVLEAAKAAAPELDRQHHHNDR